MRQKLKFLVIGVIIGGLLSSTTLGFAREGIITAQVTLKNIILSIEGKPINSSGIFYNNQVYVPLQAVAEGMGMEAKWDESTSSAAIENAYEDIEGNDTIESEVVQPNIDTYKAVDYNGMKAVVTNYGIYYRISDINKITKLNINYNHKFKILAFYSDGENASIPSPDFRVYISYKNEDYISDSIVQESVGSEGPPELSTEALKKFERTCLPKNAKYVKASYNFIKFDAVDINGNRYISQVDLCLKYNLFLDDIIGDKIKFLDSDVPLLDASNPDNYMVIGLTQYFNVAAFNKKLKNTSNSKTVLDPTYMKLRLSQNDSRLLELYIRHGDGVKNVRIIEINGTKLKKPVELKKVYNYFDNMGNNPSLKNAKFFGEGETVALKLFYEANGKSKTINVKEKVDMFLNHYDEEETY
jgi:hypothetical protein